MEKDLCRSISRSICLGYARDKIHRTQQLLERFRLCDCSELGGKGCSCVSKLGKNLRGAMNASDRHNFREKSSSSQTEERIGSSAVGHFDREDASTDVENPAVPRPLLDENRNVFTLANQRHLSEDEVYDGIRNPYVLVINNVNFYKVPRPRTGASHDRDNVRCFVKQAGFRTVVERFDLTKKDMLDLLEGTRMIGALVEHDSFICIIMSHGNEEGILGADSEAIPVEDITAKFQGGKCPQLATKPKLFFIQACRGDIDDDGYLVPRGGPGHVYPDSFDEMPVKLPSDADFLIAYSTTKGYVSHRRFVDRARVSAAQGRILGSWFISCLVQVLQRYSHKEDLMTMLTRVNNSMCREYTVQGRCKQISCQLSMLTKKVYFANYLDQESAAV